MVNELKALGLSVEQLSAEGEGVSEEDENEEGKNSRRK